MGMYSYLFLAKSSEKEVINVPRFPMLSRTTGFSSSVLSTRLGSGILRDPGNGLALYLLPDTFLAGDCQELTAGPFICKACAPVLSYGLSYNVKVFAGLLLK